MSKIESLLAHRIRRSSALIAQVEPLVQSALGAADARAVGDPLAVLHESLLWRRGLIMAQAELDQSALRMALCDLDKDSADEWHLLSDLRTQMSELIDTIAELTATLLQRRGRR